MILATETQYDQLVREGRQAREQADNVQWVEGDLALQVEALPADERPRDPETGTFVADEAKALKRYAEDVEVNYTSLKEYRRVAEAWPTTRRLAVVAWGAHQALAGQEDRFEVIQPDMTTAEARRIVRARQPKANYGGEPGWYELLGHVGADLKAAEKHLDKAITTITERVEKRGRRPSENFLAKAGEYASWAEDIAAQLRQLSSWE